MALEEGNGGPLWVSGESSHFVTLIGEDRIEEAEEPDT